MKDDGGTTAVAVVGVGAILPDAPDAATFWENVRTGRSSISEVPPARWDPELYYDPDPAAPDKTYSKIGGWVRAWTWDPLAWKLPIPPRVADAMDDAQKWAIACTRAVLEDYGRPGREAGRPRAHRGDHRQRHGRRAPLHDRAPDLLPRVRARPWPRRRRSSRSRRTSGANWWRSSGRRSGSDSRRSPRTPCPASWGTSSRGASPTCSTSGGRTSSPTPRARRPWRRSTRPFAGCCRTTSTRPSPAASTGTWALRRS